MVISQSRFKFVLPLRFGMGAIRLPPIQLFEMKHTREENGFIRCKFLPSIQRTLQVLSILIFQALSKIKFTLGFHRLSFELVRLLLVRPPA